jgi:CBS domain-containing protein
MEKGHDNPNSMVLEQDAHNQYKVLLSSLEECLTEFSVYDVLPVNSQVIVLDKLLDLAEVLQIMSQNNNDSAYCWNSDTFSYDGIITLTDLLEMIVFVYNTMSMQDPNKQNLKKMDAQGSNEGSESTFEDKAICYKENLKKFDSYAAGKNPLTETITLQPLPQLQEIDDAQFARELKAMTIQMWHNFISENILWRSHDLIAITTDERLIDACVKMRKEKLHKIAVYDKESQLVVGSLGLRDIMMFFIKNFTAEQEEIFKVEIENIKSIDIIKNVICVHESDFVYHTLEVLLHYRVSSVPVVNEKNEYIGIILKSDIYSIVRNSHFHYLSKTNGWFLEYMKQQRKAKGIEEDYSRFFFKPTDPLINVVEKLIFSPGNRLVYIDEGTKKIKGIITMIDFLYFFIQLGN